MNFSAVLNKIQSSSTRVGKICEPASQMNQTVAFLWQIPLICEGFHPKSLNLELVLLPPGIVWGLGMCKRGGECVWNTDWFIYFLLRILWFFFWQKFSGKLQLGKMSLSSLISFWGSSDCVCWSLDQRMAGVDLKDQIFCVFLKAHPELCLNSLEVALR